MDDLKQKSATNNDDSEIPIFLQDSEEENLDEIKQHEQDIETEQLPGQEAEDNENESKIPDNIETENREPKTLAAADDLIEVENQTAEECDQEHNNALHQLSEKIDGLTTQVKEYDRRNDISRDAIAKLHKEMLDYKEDFITKNRLPILKSLLQILDDMDSMVIQTEPITTNDIRYLAEQIIEILECCGAEEIDQTEGKVDGSVHKVLKTEPTSNNELHGCIFSVSKRGWRLSNKVLRPIGVIAYTFQPDESTENAHKNETESSQIEKEKILEVSDE